MVAIMVEKPSAARNFAKALGGMSGSFEGTAYQIVTARGHLFEFAPPEKQVAPGDAARMKDWALENLPWQEQSIQWSREKKTDVASVLAAAKPVLKAASEICIAGDVDPSGEGFLIQVEILDELGIRPKKATRMYFTDEAAPSIQKAFRGRKAVADIHKNEEYLMAWYRTRWDFLSMQWTRVASKCGGGPLLRQGRLKSAMVLLVGDQLKLCGAYKKIPYYQNRFRDENGVVYTSPEEPSFSSKDQVPQVYHGSAVVLNSREKKTSGPPKFLDLSTLSSRLASKGHKAKTVLDVYQKLYQDSILSYPRTEDRVITPEQFDELLPKIDAIARVIGVDPGILTHRTPRKTHVKTGGAHGANRPGPNVPASLDALDKYGPAARDIYEMLARNYLACLCEDYEYEAQKGHLAEYPKFTGQASVPLKAGWKAVYGADEDPDEDENARGLGTRAEPFVHEGFPPKPATPTMKWLMKQLEGRDIGTGATRTSTYSEVTEGKNALMADKKGKISMTDAGELSYKLLPGTRIGDLEITKRVQEQMKAIAAGTFSADAGLSEVGRMVVEDIAMMKQNAAALGITCSSGGGSGGTYEKKEKVTGKYKGRREVSFNAVWSGHRFTESEIERLLAGDEISFEAVSAKTGRAFTARGSLKEQTYNGRKFWGFKADFGK